MKNEQASSGTKRSFFKKLEKEFESTFGDDLIPGILHNFASPLNGILGRTEFLEERTSKIHELIINNVNKIDDEILKNCKKISDDAGLIVTEADRFIGLFNDVAGKFQSLCDTDLQRINLSELIEAEMAFLEFYPDFKDNIKKSLILDKKIPEVVIGVSDPNPAVAGKGIEILKHAGVKIRLGVLENESINLNRKFFTNNHL